MTPATRQCATLIAPVPDGTADASVIRTSSSFSWPNVNRRWADTRPLKLVFGASTGVLDKDAESVRGGRTAILHACVTRL